MNHHSYKQYLEFINRKPQSFAKKFFLLILAILLILGGGVSAFWYFQYKKEQPIRDQSEYLEVVNNGFNSTKQSLDDLLTTFQVAGAKIKFVDELKESSAAASGFFTSLDDLSKTVANIEATYDLVLDQQKQLEVTVAPANLKDLKNQLGIYYSETTEVLGSIADQQKFAKDLLFTLGPNFYLPILTDETLWSENNQEVIVDYYKKIKIEAGEVLAKLGSLTVPSDFEQYYITQQSYLELLVKTADRIETVLSKKDEGKKDYSNLEEAYQVLTAAKRENEELADELLLHKLKLFSTTEYLNKFAPVKIHQHSIEAKLDAL